MLPHSGRTQSHCGDDDEPLLVVVDQSKMQGWRFPELEGGASSGWDVLTWDAGEAGCMQKQVLTWDAGEAQC